MELSVMSVEELEALAVEVKEALKVAKAEAKEDAAAEKAEKAEYFKGVLNAGDVVTFLYGKDNVESEGTVVRVSEKSATVKSEVFENKTGKNYVRFDRFVEVLEAADVEETEAEEAV